MSEIPKAPVWKCPLILPCDGGLLEKNINAFIAAEWAKLFEGAEVVYGTELDADAWTNWTEKNDTRQAIRLKPVPIKKWESPVLKGKIDDAIMNAIRNRFEHASLADQRYVLECVQEVWNAERAKESR